MFEEIFIDWIIGISVIIVAVYSYNVYKHSYWNRKNVVGPKPVLIVGNLMQVISRKSSVHEVYRDLYLAWKHEPFVGMYQTVFPVLLINDPALIKQIWVKDFTTFSDRGFPLNDDVDPLITNLVTLESHRWKKLRHNLTPLFTSGKLKQMYHLLNECADVFEKYIEKLVANGEPIEMRELCAKFTTDVIGSCAFGLNLNALTSEESEFRKMGRRIVAFKFVNNLKIFIQNVFPRIFKLLKIRMISKKDTKFFMDSIATTIAYRKKNGIIRHDFINLMTELQRSLDGTDFELTDELLAGQAFVFFLAGFETSSTALSYALYELALYQNIQDKLRAEIRAAFKIHNGQLPFETIEDLEYLDKVYKETLRKNPPLPTLPRAAAKDYTIPGTGVQIPAGMRVFISVIGLHHDPQYYPNPEVFDPDRFSDEAIRQRPQMVYLPFGAGPRNCIGSRFAQYQTKIGIIRILKNYRITMSSQTEVPYRLSNHIIASIPRNGIYLNFSKIP